MKIAYCPYDNKSNKYVLISKDVLQRVGCQLYDFKKLKIKNYKNIDVVFLNWYESLNTSNIIKYILHVFQRVFKIFVLKKNGCRIIFTFHNRLPHDSKSWLQKILGFYLLHYLCHTADRIMILSEDSRQYLSQYLIEKEISEKVFYIPHPNYIGAYSAPMQENVFYHDGKFKILFTGAIKPYKNIELIIKAANELADLPIEFTITGACKDDYADELKALASTENIKFQFGFVADDKIDELIRQHDILLLPYDITSSMNSGTAILAFSNGRTVICPDISTIKEYDEDLTYHYVYQNEEEHLIKMKESILKAYNDWKNNSLDFEQKGTQLYEAVKKKNSQEAIAERYQELFEKI